MARSQIYKTRKRVCDRCKVETRNCEKVSKRILPPSGGHLCLNCLVPAALDAITRDKQSSITCPRCFRTSHHPEDIKQGYCGYCHWWTSDPLLGPFFDEVYPEGADNG